MTSLTKGSLVHHSSLGLGKVVAVEATAVHVFFPDSEKRHAAKLRWPMAKALLRTESLERNSWLEGLSSFELDPVTRRYSLAENWLSHDQAVAEFLERNPAGFGGGEPAAGVRGSRATRWTAAQALWTERLGRGQGEALLSGGDRGELVRRLRELGLLVSRTVGVLEDGSLQSALADPDRSRAYLETLFAALATATPNRARMDELFATASAVADPGAAWPLATLFPFLAHPGRHMLLQPKVARIAAARLGCDLRYDAAPNWATYVALRGFAGQLLERLKPIGAADFADVEVFLHAVAARRPAADPGASNAPARPLKEPARARLRRSAAHSG